VEARSLTALPDADIDTAYADQRLRAVIDAFSAGEPVPGSGSANALAAALAAALVISVARKTSGKDDLRYLSVRETMKTIARQAGRSRKHLIDLIDLDAKAFAPVIAIRRKTGKLSDPLLQDRSLRAEIASLRPATEIPQEIADRAIDVAAHAVTLYEIGFTPARGEAFTALTSAIAAAESSLMVAQINVSVVRNRVARLHDPELEADWLERMRVRDRQLHVRLRQVKRRQLEITKRFSEHSAPPKAEARSQPTRRRGPRSK
jgi:formiminotetrahydrofolate cyclodeaminase